MGIRIHRNTWSAPLQLIDSWLPPARPAPTRPRALSVVAQRFVQAGWLHRRASNDETAHTPADVGAPARHVAPARLTGTPRRRDPRVWLSGRMTDVCAELDRLVELETQGVRAHG